MGLYHSPDKEDFISIRGLSLWSLDLQLPMQSVPIINKVVSSNPVHSEVY
jgi:hypothetical protein